MVSKARYMPREIVRRVEGDALLEVAVVVRGVGGHHRAASFACATGDDLHARGVAAQPWCTPDAGHYLARRPSTKTSASVGS